MKVDTQSLRSLHERKQAVVVWAHAPEQRGSVSRYRIVARPELCHPRSISLYFEKRLDDDALNAESWGTHLEICGRLTSAAGDDDHVALAIRDLIEFAADKTKDYDELCEKNGELVQKLRQLEIEAATVPA